MVLLWATWCLMAALLTKGLQDVGYSASQKEKKKKKKEKKFNIVGWYSICKASNISNYLLPPCTIV